MKSIRERIDARVNGPDVWISVKRYCELYALNRKTVYKYLDNGLLDSWQVGRVLRVQNKPPHTTKAQRQVR